MMKSNHINYFDLGLWKDAAEIEIMVEDIFPKFENITYNIYGIEANPNFCESIRKKFANYKNIKIFNLAINNQKNDIVKLYKANNQELGNSIFKTKNNVSENDFYIVPSNTFSNWLCENNIELENSINILKVNIEGSELFLWQDFKDNNLVSKFNILCGYPLDHDIKKVSELKSEINRYFELLNQLNINMEFFCHVDKNLSIKTMEKLLNKYLKENI